MVQYTNITLKDCIRAAYRVRDFQIQGPSWINDDRFVITAKLPAGAEWDQIPEMLATLLEERFKLTLRRDSKEQSVYALITGKTAPKLKPAEHGPDSQTPTAVGPDGKPRGPMMFTYVPSGIHLVAPSTSLNSFVEVMSRFTERPVVNLTGIEGQFDLELTFAPETLGGVPAANRPSPDTTRSSDEPAHSVFDAVQQYGLLLERRRTPMLLLTVSHIERTPTEN